MPFAQVADVLLVHRSSLDRVIVDDRPMRRPDWRQARPPVRDRRAVMHDLDRGERTVFVHCVRHQRHRRDVAIVPQASFVERFTVGARMDFGFFRRHHRPPAFGLDSTKPRKGLGLGPAYARAVRDLVKAVARRDRPDPHRLEQNVVTRIARHDGRIASIVSPRRSTIMSSSSSVTLYGGASRMWSPARPSAVPPPG